MNPGDFAARLQQQLPAAVGTAVVGTAAVGTGPVESCIVISQT